MKEAVKNILRPLYRALVLRWLGFARVGHAVYVNHTVRVTYAKNIILGNRVHIHFGSELRAGPDSRIELADDCRIGPFATLQAEVGFIHIGANSYVGPQTILRGDGGLTVGENALISPQVIIMSANHVFKDPTVPIRLQGETHQGIIIEDDVWIGSSAKIMDGVHVSRGTVVAAGAVVTHNTSANTVVAGVPASVIGQRGQ